jgi:hypothetical protein
MMSLKTSEILMMNYLIILIKKEKVLSLGLKQIFYNFLIKVIKDIISLRN